MKVKFRNIVKIDQTQVICDTNVWYGFSQGKPTDTDENHILIPTSLTLAELATSEVIVHDTKLFQETIKAIYEKCGPIISLDPIDYVLRRQDLEYPTTDRRIKNLLEGFSYLLSLNIDGEIVVDNKLKNLVIEKFRTDRKASNSFAEYANSKINQIRKEINKGIGKEKHLDIDTTNINKDMVKSIFNEHVKGTVYTIDWDKFDWSKIDLFMKVTEIFFKKLETTRDMKVKPNDAVDWLNILYVSPDDKYLTLEGSWRRYIEEDERIKHYLYK
jgi:hypothetical protein